MGFVEEFVDSSLVIMVDNLVPFLSRFCLLLSFTFHVWFTTSSSLQHERLVTRMIHRDSILSPYYNKSSTISDRASFTLKSSMARLAYLSSKASGGIHGPLVPSPSKSLFYLNVSIGEPPTPQLVVMDTGSDLLWVQCEPCSKCVTTGLPIFNPRKSSTYAPVTCHAPECNSGIILHGDCDPDGYCAYKVAYQDSTSSSGVIAYEKFTFETVNKGASVAPSVLFGCGTTNDFKFAKGSGILGLSADPVSVVSSFGSKFSYCIGNISDPNYTSNTLILGNGALMEGYTTTFQIRDALCFVSLVGISVGETEIAINPQEFKFKVVIDTGSTLSYLARSAFDPLRAEVEKIVNGTLELVTILSNPDLLCYKGNYQRDARGFPTVTFHLDEGTDIDMDIEGLFFNYNENTFCMAINAAPDGYNIIGIIAQQYYNVGYDLKANKVSFERIDCSVLENSVSTV